LVVVTIIAILAGVLLPVVSNVMLTGRQTACLSNMRQLGAAMHLYAADHDFKLPETSHTASVGNTWIHTLAPYLENVDEVRISPGDPKGQQRLEEGGTSYVLNSYLFVPEMDPFGEVTGGPSNDLKQIETTSRTIMAFVCADRVGLGAGNDHTHSSGWNSWANVVRDIAPDRFTGSKKPDHSIGSSNYLYADGHVEKLAALAIKTRIDSGDNIALPR